MEFTSIYSNPKGAKKYADQIIASAKFTREELISFGVKNDSDDLDPHYIEENEYNKLMELWADPLYLSKIFEDNKRQLKDKYWKGITLDQFVDDILVSAPYIFENIERCFYNKEIDNIFKPLGKDDKTKIDHTICKVKSKFGKILNKYAFRIYAIKIEDGCYLITGGAIKMSKAMQDADNTMIELKKLKHALKELHGKEIEEQASFVEFIFE